MEHKQTLQRRIIIAFFLLTMILCGGFAAVMYFVIHELETELFYDHLQQDAEWMIRANKQDIPLQLPDGIQLYRIVGNNEADLPDYLQGLTSDRSEIVLDDKAFHVIVQSEGDTRYYLVQDQSRFEETEKIVAVGIALAFAGALFGALWLGSVTANRVIAPVIRLAKQVGSLNDKEIYTQSLAYQYPNDEVGQLASAFEQYTQRLQGFLDRERLFTGDVSHELRTPLMVITSSCELLESKPGLDDKSQQAIARIYNAAQEMRLLVNAFLMLSRESGNASGQTSSFSANTVVTEEINYLEGLSNTNKAIDIHLVENAMLDVLGIPQLFRAIIRNLLRNAFLYTREGTISVTINQATILVEDTGLGIPVELRDSVFDRHVRALNDNDAAQGQGLGLSIVKRICDYHHWHISLEPVAPSGSRFILDVSPRRDNDRTSLPPI